MSLRLRSAEPPGRALRQALCGLVKAAERDLRSLSDHPERRVHSLRTGMKKYRALLRLAREAVGREMRTALLLRVRVIKDGLGGSRDATAVAKTARRLLGKAAAERLGAGKPAPLSGSAAVPEAVASAAHELAVLTEALDLEGVTKSRLLRRWRRSCRKARRAMKAARTSAEAPDFHRWRRRMKDVWYQAEALKSLCGDAAGARKAAGRISDHLGDEHDLTLTLETLPQLTDADRARIEAERRRLRERALKGGRELLR